MSPRIAIFNEASEDQQSKALDEHGSEMDRAMWGQPWKPYVKICGSPIMDALKELQKIAGEMPKVAHLYFLEALEAMPTTPTTPKGALSSSRLLWRMAG